MLQPDFRSKFSLGTLENFSAEDHNSRGLKKPRVGLVCLANPNGGRPDFKELKALTTSAGANVIFEVTAKREGLNSGLFVGSGKLAEIKHFCEQYQTSLVIFGQELSPIQQRNLSQYLDCRVIDRVALILDIFALRANSHEGKVQVELAQLEYLSSRLVRGWTHLERQKGGIGLRGPGETQLETDRRLIGAKVKRLRHQLHNLEKQRVNRRRAREKSGMLNVSLIGYTNAGKSTLFNALAKSKVYTANQLFATLDTTSRKVFLTHEKSMILSDTVGFINELPHGLIEAFKATLQETVYADLLIHVVDYADENWRSHMADVEIVLKEVKAEKVARINLFNKIDLKGVDPRVEHDQYGRINKVWISAEENKGLDLLKQAVISHILYNENVDVKGNLDSCMESTDPSVLKKEKSPSTESLL